MQVETSEWVIIYNAVTIGYQGTNIFCVCIINSGVRFYHSEYARKMPYYSDLRSTYIDVQDAMNGIFNIRDD